jgi:hypothetical protein
MFDFSKNENHMFFWTEGVTKLWHSTVQYYRGSNLYYTIKVGDPFPSIRTLNIPLSYSKNSTESYEQYHLRHELNGCCELYPPGMNVCNSTP